MIPKPLGIVLCLLWGAMLCGGAVGAVRRGWLYGRRRRRLVRIESPRQFWIVVVLFFMLGAVWIGIGMRLLLEWWVAGRSSILRV